MSMQTLLFSKDCHFKKSISSSKVSNINGFFLKQFFSNIFMIHSISISHYNQRREGEENVGVFGHMWACFERERHRERI